MKKINALLFVMLFVLGGIACERTPLGHRASTVVSDDSTAAAVGTSSATAIKTDTSSVPPLATVQTTAVQTGSDTGATTSTVTTTPTATVTTTATDTNTETVSTNGCMVGTTMDIGNGIDPSIAGSDSGFGIIWKDNTLMPAQMNHGMFARVDIGGNKKSAGLVYLSTKDIIGERIGIATMTNGYALSMDYPGLGQRSTFMLAGFDGTMSPLVNNQPVTEPIVGSMNEGFTFLDQGEGFPALHKVQIGPDSLIDEKVYQWGPQNSFHPVTVGAQVGGTWAFGMMDNFQLEIVVVKDGGVYPNTISGTDIPSMANNPTMDDFIATDVGYVLAWWYFDANANYRHFLSFVPSNSTPDGMVKQTIETTSFSDPVYAANYLAWNGKNIGLLATNQETGESNFVLLRNDGSQIGDALSVFPVDNNRPHSDIGGKPLAASGGVFGIVRTSSTGDKAQFTPVTCN